LLPVVTEEKKSKKSKKMFAKLPTFIFISYRVMCHFCQKNDEGVSK